MLSTAADFLRESESGSLDYEDFLADYMAALKKTDKKYNFFREIADPKPPEKLQHPFYGLPVSVKDCICVKGMRSSAGSRILENYMPPFNATVVENVLSKGAVVAGKTNQDEFGFGTFSTNSCFGIPKNPFDEQKSCGGSSGGSAGIVAAMKLPHISIAESTGGSISCPAAFCGVAGLTPTYGLVSRYGLIDYANSLDKIGTIARTVWDAAFMLNVLAGHDQKDSTSLNRKTGDYTKGIDKSLKGLKIGLPVEYFGEGVDAAVADSVWAAAKKLEGFGAEYQEISLPHTKYSLPAYYLIATAEASTNLAKYCGMRYGAEEDVDGGFNEYFSKIRTKYFGREAKRRILLGTFARMAGYRDQYYLKAQKVRALVIQDFKKAFGKIDVLAAPTMPVTAPKFSEIEKLTPLQNYMMDILTVAPNLAGIPMLSVPCGKVKGMPVGLHLMADHLQEKKILNVGWGFENL